MESALKSTCAYVRSTILKQFVSTYTLYINSCELQKISINLLRSLGDKALQLLYRVFNVGDIDPDLNQLQYMRVEDTIVNYRSNKHLS